MALLAGWESNDITVTIPERSRTTLQLCSLLCPLCGEVRGELVGNRVCPQCAREGFLEEMG